MQLKNEKPNLIIFELNSDCTRIEKISLEPKAFRFVDGIMALLARSFRIANWGALRHLAEYQSRRIVVDARKTEKGCRGRYPAE
ncbi:MAG: hypothetical protein Q7U40_07635 [Desulfatirhabdiaceae bacterium]|nr:hypothetical protein [Desulfatirhabdiaceae bacterium]